MIADMRVEGNGKTSERLVREQLELEPGAAARSAALGRSRRNLYDTGAFSMVDITREPDAPTSTERESRSPHRRNGEPCRCA